jgi:hypothetical protein
MFFLSFKEENAYDSKIFSGAGKIIAVKQWLRYTRLYYSSEQVSELLMIYRVQNNNPKISSERVQIFSFVYIS